MELFKDRLKQAMKFRNFRAIDLCNKTGISQATMSQYLSGYSRPKKERLILLAGALDVDPSWLLGIDTKRNDGNSITRKVNVGQGTKGKPVITIHYKNFVTVGEAIQGKCIAIKELPENRRVQISEDLARKFFGCLGYEEIK